MITPSFAGGIAGKPDFLRPTWAEIRLSAVRGNLLKIRGLIPARCAILFVVKANAYGHGAAELALFSQKEKLCYGFGVSCVEEASVLRRAGVTLPVLVLGSLYPFDSFVKAIQDDLKVTVASVDAAKQLVTAAGRLKTAVGCHVKLETGMGRIGVRRPGAARVFEELLSSRNIKIEGIYTHLSSADSDPEFTRLQLRYFREAVEDCEKAGINPGLRHAANSAAAVNYPESRWDMVRPGLAVYGLMDDFEPALSLKSRVVFLKNIRAGSSISYGRTFRSKKPMSVATLPVGYADGYSRRLSNCGEVLVRGKRCRVLGAVTMDMTMIDVTNVADVGVGDEAVLIGRQGEEEVTARDIAALTGTIPYETVCSISSRVPRVFTP